MAMGLRQVYWAGQHEARGCGGEIVTGGQIDSDWVTGISSRGVSSSESLTSAHFVGWHAKRRPAVDAQGRRPDGLRIGPRTVLGTASQGVDRELALHIGLRHQLRGREDSVPG